MKLKYDRKIFVSHQYDSGLFVAWWNMDEGGVWGVHKKTTIIPPESRLWKELHTLFTTHFGPHYQSCKYVHDPVNRLDLQLFYAIADRIEPE